MKKIALIIPVAAAMMALTANAQTWNVDKAHAKLGFNVTHLLISEVDGYFKTFDAKFTSSKEDFSDAVIQLTADAASINTDNEKRDNHLRSADFFDVAQYPSLSFKSNSFKKVEGKKYLLSGDLTMHGVTKPVTLDVVYNGSTTNMQGKKLAGFKVTGTLKRSDFNIGTSMPTAVVSDEVNLTANAEFIAATESGSK